MIGYVKTRVWLELRFGAGRTFTPHERTRVIASVCFNVSGYIGGEVCALLSVILVHFFSLSDAVVIFFLNKMIITSHSSLFREILMSEK